MAGGIVDQLSLSYRMTKGALRMTLAYPPSLLVAFANLLVLLAVAAGPIAWMVYLLANDPGQFWWALNHVFQFWFVTARYQAMQAGQATFQDVVGAFSLWVLFIYIVWASLVAFFTMVTTTVILHTGVQQIRGEKPRLRDGAALAGRNLHRLLGLAFLAGALMGLVRRLLGTLRVVPILGRLVRRAVVAAITATLYVALPTVVYEREGVVAGFRSTWHEVRETWGGLVVGTGFLLVSLWLLLWLVEYAVLGSVGAILHLHLVNWTLILILQILAAAALYALNVALAANLRASLYLHVREGRASFVPSGAIARPEGLGGNEPKPAATFSVVQEG